jgi:pentatricopeptide repeat protein
MSRAANWGWILLLIGLLAAPGFSQEIKDQKEYDAYKAVWDEKDPAKKAALAEKFLTDFPMTTAKKETYNMMFLAFAQAGNWAKALEYVEKLPQYVPNADNALKKTVYQVGFASAQNLRNVPKTKEYAEKVLTLDPNEINSLVALSGILSSTLPTAEPARDTQLTASMDITKRALAQPKPAGIPDTAWNPVLVQLNRTVCLLLLNKKQYPESIGACEAALKLDKKDSGSYYLIGLAHKYQVPALDKKYRDSVDEYNANRTADQITVAELKGKVDATQKVAEDKLNEAIDALATSVAIGGVPEARTELEALYKGSHNGSLDGLDQLIAAKKAQI